jgi:hypothetical protein
MVAVRSTTDNSSDNVSNKENVNPFMPVHSRYHPKTCTGCHAFTFRSPVKGGASSATTTTTNQQQRYKLKNPLVVASTPLASP